MRVDLVALAISSLLQGMETAYTINYYDCNNPSKASTYQNTEACNHNTKETNTPSAYALLQRKLTNKITRFSFTITHSNLTQYSGA